MVVRGGSTNAARGISGGRRDKGVDQGFRNMFPEARRVRGLISRFHGQNLCLRNVMILLFSAQALVWVHERGCRTLTCTTSIGPTSCVCPTLNSRQRNLPSPHINGLGSSACALETKSNEQVPVQCALRPGDGRAISTLLLPAHRPPPPAPHRARRCLCHRRETSSSTPPTSSTPRRAAARRRAPICGPSLSPTALASATCTPSSTPRGTGPSGLSCRRSRGCPNTAPRTATGERLRWKGSARGRATPSFRSRSCATDLISVVANLAHVSHELDAVGYAKRPNPDVHFARWKRPSSADACLSLKLHFRVIVLA